DSRAARTPAWSSADGKSWQPLAASTFGSTSIVLGVVPTPGGMAAVTVQAGTSTCSPSDPVSRDCFLLGRPIEAWTSADGATWSRHPFPDLSTLGTGLAPWFTAIDSGLLVAIPADSGTLDEATASDGTDWRLLRPARTPGEGSLADLRSTSVGTLGVGPITADAGGQALALSTGDGVDWRSTSLPAGSTAGGSGIELAGTRPTEAGRTIFAGRTGVIVDGGVVATPGQELWWQTSDGRSWRILDGYPPLGPTSGAGEGAGSGAAGSLSADGDRIVAYRDRPTAAAWDSFDGDAWHPLAMTGRVPTGPVAITVLPWGLLATGDSGTWWGEASTH
ncbi:MAG TPA: hypothetical protein VEG29_06715, partial [Candidatus Binatia bacterium]|nr:hypothetical protein [Candidatus Binatia bacterium]